MPRPVLVRAFVFATAFGVLAGCSSGSEGRGPEPGTDLYAVTTDDLREILFTSADRKVYGYRWRTDERFNVVSANRGEVVKTCQADERFDDVVAAVSRMPVLRALEGTAGGDAVDWGQLSLRDDSQVDPIEVRVRIPKGPEERVVIDWQGQLFEVGVPTASVLELVRGCA